MKSIKLLIFFLTFATALTAQDQDICGLENTAYQKGEQLRYKLYYNLAFMWIPAGEVNFHITETDSTYEAEIIGKSYDSYDKIFKVRNEFYGTIRKSDMLPLSFVRRVEQGSHLRFDSLRFDYKNQLIYSQNGDTRASAIKETIPLKACTQDFVSIMYNLRNIDINDYEPGDKISGNTFFDRSYTLITIEYIKRQKKKIKRLGKFRTIKIRPEILIGNVFKKGDKMDIWISDDGNKIPLQIQSNILVGSVKAILVEHSGLKHKLSKL